MWQTLLLWFLASLLMLICLPCHLLMHGLSKLFGFDISLNPMKKHINKDQTDIVEDEGKCRKFSFKTARGIKYTVHTCSIAPVIHMHKGRAKHHAVAAHILCVHGAYSNSATWHKTMVDMSKKGHTVHAIDLPGFGQSSFPEELMALSVDDLVDELSIFMLKCMDSLEISRAILVGHSFGGFVCSISVRNEELRSRIRAITLVAPAGVFPIGTRWGHLYAVVFRLKMLSFISPDMQSRGENLITRFFNTGFNGSKWLFPSLPTLLNSKVPCTVISGTSDPIFTIDHGLLVQEVTCDAIKFKPCIFSDHFVKDDSILQQTIVEEVSSFCRPITRNELKRRSKCTQERNTLLAKGIERLNAKENIVIGIEANAFFNAFKSYRIKLLETCRHVDSIAQISKLKHFKIVTRPNSPRRKLRRLHIIKGTRRIRPITRRIMNKRPRVV